MSITVDPALYRALGGGEVPHRLSVVIPFANSRNWRDTLHSLSQQTIGKSFELLLATEAPARKVRQFGERLGLGIRVLRYRRPPGFSGHSAGRLRNLGARSATGEILAFIDSDCVLAPDCLENHLAAHDQANDQVVCGAYRELSVAHQNAPYGARYQHRDYCHLAIRDHRVSEPDPDRWQHMYSGNVSMPAALFHRVCGFDEEGHRIHDLDLGYRLHLAGAHFRYAAQCCALHIEHPRSIGHRLEQASGWRHLAAKHPELYAYAESRALAVEQLHDSILTQCERTFEAITSELPGARIGTAWILPPWCDESQLQSVLRHVTHLDTPGRDGRVFQLRLNRNCWDFTIVAPDAKVLDLPRVSVLIPAYEAASTICRSVESVLAQTWQSFEIIVVDDGSGDETSAALATYQFDGRLRLLQDGTNRGQSRALNWALEVARGEIVVQLDADDWLERDALASIVACFDRRPGTGAVFADARAHEPSGNFVASGPSLRSPADCLTYSAVQAPRAYRADLIRQIGGWSVNDEHEGRLFEDRVTLARICAAAPVRHIRRVLYNFDARPNSLHRREPWRTNKAKYLILTAAANQLRCELRVTEGPRPRYALVPKGERRRRRGWSIVIPAHDRPDLLRIALTSWLQSDACDGEAAEIIVVDDGTPNRLENTVDLQHPRLRFVRHDRRRGPAAARNTGAAEAKFEMLFFSDGDHVVPPDVLGEHEHRHDSLAIDALVVGGLYGRKVATALEPSLLEPHTIARIMELSRFDRQRMEAIAAATAFGGTVDLCPPMGGELFARLHTQSFSDAYLSVWFDYLSPWSVEEPEALRFLRLRTGNLSLPVPLFRLLGGFDATLGEMEDWELGIRALAAGVTIEFAPRAEPLHQLHPPNNGATETLRASWQILRDKHPAAISQLPSALGRASPPGSSVIRSLLRALPDVRSPRSNPKLMAKPEVALTFDDGPHPVGTPPMLQILREAGARATFFLLSTNCQRYAHIVREIVDSGCEIGVHGRTHDSVVGHPTEDVLEELFRATEEISDIAGARPRFCRPPYGLGSQAYFEAAQMLGLQPVGWDVSLGDWRPSPRPELLTRLALASVIGKVVLLHDATGDLSGTSQAVRWLLTAGADAGLKGRTLTEFSKRSNLPPLEPPAS